MTNNALRTNELVKAHLTYEQIDALLFLVNRRMTDIGWMKRKNADNIKELETLIDIKKELQYAGT